MNPRPAFQDSEFMRKLAGTRLPSGLDRNCGPETE
jgi:hypothetical protein